MRRKIVNIIAIFVGIGIGIFVSSRIEIFQEVKIVSSDILNQIKKEAMGEVKEYKDNLVLVESAYDGFIIDLKYATENNITKSVLYPKPLCFLQKSTLDKLIQANEELKSHGYKIKIWDAYRPLAVQRKLWAANPDATYIANPFNGGSNHNRGASVDITLVDLYGNSVEMPTGFDEFGFKAHRGYNAGKEVNERVDLLTEVMTKNGFDTINSEWWHYDDKDVKNYVVKDYDFRELMKL